MLLAIDVGNTNTVLGVYEGDELIHHWRVYSEKHKTADEYGVLFKHLLADKDIQPSSVNRVIISSVVPPLTTIFVEMIKRYYQLNPLIVNTEIKKNIKIKMDYPRELGADRLVNAVAAYKMYGGPLIVVDFGTATTFCAISATGDYLGGAIAPGIGISTEALFDYASKLPRIELKKPAQVIGKNTIASMQSGIVFGYAGQVKYLIELFKQELAEEAKVVATGGLAALVADECPEIDEVNPFLTLQGLKLLAEMNGDFFN